MKHYIRGMVVLALLASVTLQYTGSGFLLSAAQAQATGSIDISWEPPTEYTDGVALLEQDLDFYTLYCNDAELKQIDAIIGTHADTVDLTSLPTGDYTCHLTTTSLEAQESGPSNTINFILGPRVPMAPAGLSSP
jgi:hypothetical protein